MVTRNSRRPSQRPLLSDLPSPNSPHLSGPLSGISSEGTGYDQSGATLNGPVIRDHDNNPHLLPGGNTTIDSFLPKEEHYLASASQSYSRNGSWAPVFADAEASDGKVASDSGFNPGIQPYVNSLGHGSWHGMAQEHQLNLPGGEVMPFDQGSQYPPTAPTLPMSWFGPDDFDSTLQEAFVPLPGVILSDNAPQFASQYGNSASVSELGVTQDQIFDSKRRFSDVTLVFPANLSKNQGLLEDPVSWNGDYATTLPIASPTWKQSDGEHEFQITLRHGLSRPNIEELNKAAANSKLENLYHFQDYRKPARRHNMASDIVPPTTMPTMKPRRQKTERSSETETNPASDLIRDASPPGLKDFTERAQVIRVAVSARGRQTDFTFADHYDIIVACLHEQLVIELNRKLRVGLDLRGRHLVRNMPMRINDDPELLRTIDFVQKSLQANIDWAYCQEHMDLLDSLDKNKPDLNLEELDCLIKDTGVWIFEQQWLNDHPGEERGAY